MPEVPRCIHKLLVAGALLAGAGCSVFDGELVDRRRIDLPCDIVAAVTAGALAEALTATPPDAGGAAPIRARSDGGFEVGFARDRHDRWSADTDGRIALRCEADGSTQVVSRPATCRIEPARRTGELVVLLLRPDDSGTGTELQLLAPDTVRRDLSARLDRALQLATDHELAAPGLTEPNLSAWRLGQLVAAARQCSATQPQAAGELLRSAARLPQAPACVHAELAELAAGNGDQARALAGYRRAALLANDPQQRATWSRAAQQLLPANDEPAQLRSAAIEHLERGQATIAETLLHSARRAARTPSVDYDLLSRVHRQDGDDLAALAAGLLAREFGADDTGRTITWLEHLALRSAPTPAMAAAPPR